MFRLLFNYKLVHVLLRESVGFRRVSAYYGGIIHADLINILFLILKIFTVE